MAENTKRGANRTRDNAAYTGKTLEGLSTLVPAMLQSQGYVSGPLLQEQLAREPYNIPSQYLGANILAQQLGLRFPTVPLALGLGAQFPTMSAGWFNPQNPWNQGRQPIEGVGLLQNLLQELPSWPQSVRDTMSMSPDSLYSLFQGLGNKQYPYDMSQTAREQYGAGFEQLMGNREAVPRAQQQIADLLKSLGL